MTYQCHCSTGSAAARSCSAVRASSTEKSPSRSDAGPDGSPWAVLISGSSASACSRKSARSASMSRAPGVELGVDAGGPHEEVVGAPQVLGQGAPGGGR